MKQTIETAENEENVEKPSDETGNEKATHEKSGFAKLMQQIIKFAIVGGLSFVIDFAITMVVSGIVRSFGSSVEIAAAIGGAFGFCISLIFNYFMSMKFVFQRKDNMKRKTEFMIFTLLSAIGLGLNELILYFGVRLCNLYFPVLVSDRPSLVTAVVKIIATAIVMIYNFISRKLTLEKKEK